MAGPDGQSEAVKRAERLLREEPYKEFLTPAQIKAHEEDTHEAGYEAMREIADTLDEALNSGDEATEAPVMHMQSEMRRILKELANETAKKKERASSAADIATIDEIYQKQLMDYRKLITGMVDKYKGKSKETVLQATRELVGTTMMMEMESEYPEIVDDFMSVVSGEDLDYTQIQRLVKYTKKGEITSQPNASHAAMGMMLNRLGTGEYENFEKYGTEFIRQNGVTEFMQLGEALVAFGSLTPRRLAFTLERAFVNLGEDSPHNADLERAIADFDYNFYEGMARGALEELKEATVKMRPEDKNALEKGFTWKNVGKVLGTVWGLTVFSFNAMSEIKAGGSLAKKLERILTNGYAITGLATAGFAMKSADKSFADYLPDTPKEVEEKDKAEAKGVLMDIYETHISFAYFLEFGGAAAIIEADDWKKKYKQIKKGEDPDTPASQIERSAAKLTEMDAQVIGDYIADYSNAGNAEELLNRLADLKNRYENPKLSKMLNNVQRAMMVLGIHTQEEYNEFIDENALT